MVNVFGVNTIVDQMLQNSAKQFYALNNFNKF